MKQIFKGIFFALSLSINLSSIGQTSIVIDDSVYSNVLKEQRKLSVYLPPSIRSNKDSLRKYPVLYVLDGNSHRYTIAGMMEHFTTAGNAILPEMIVVCIPNTQRTRDLTPYAVAAGGFMDSAMASQTGGADNFIKCIQQDIIPYVNQKYPTSSYRALIGHSFGGIFALHVLANYKDLFEDYIIIDPSMWYDNRKFAQKVLDQLKKQDYSGKSVFLTIANTSNITDTNQVKKIKTALTEHENSIIAFNAQIKAVQNGLKYSMKYYPDDDHTGVAMMSMYDGLRYIFKEYKFSYNDMVGKDYHPLTDLPNFFDKLSKKIGYPSNIPEDILQLADFYYQTEKDKTRQDEIRKLYLNLYPEKAKVYLEKKK